MTQYVHPSTPCLDGEQKNHDFLHGRKPTASSVFYYVTYIRSTSAIHSVLLQSNHKYWTFPHFSDPSLWCGSCPDPNLSEPSPAWVVLTSHLLVSWISIRSFIRLPTCAASSNGAEPGPIGSIVYLCFPTGFVCLCCSHYWVKAE